MAICVLYKLSNFLTLHFPFLYNTFEGISLPPPTHLYLKNILLTSRLVKMYYFLNPCKNLVRNKHFKIIVLHVWFNSYRRFGLTLPRYTSCLSNRLPDSVFPAPLSPLITMDWLAFSWSINWYAESAIANM